jgi:hypothetical protein
VCRTTEQLFGVTGGKKWFTWLSAKAAALSQKGGQEFDL